MGSLSAAARNREVADHRAPDLEPTLTDRGQMGAAGDERHVVPGADEFGSVVTADRTRAQNRNSHVVTLIRFLASNRRRADDRQPRIDLAPC